MGDLTEIKEMLQATLAGLKQEVEGSKQQIRTLMDENRQLRDTVEKLSKKVDSRNEDKLKKEVISKFRRHKKEMIKHKIIEMVRIKRTSLPELKEIIVDQMAYCSKATFYRYYDELRKEGTISEKNKMIVSNVLSIV